MLKQAETRWTKQKGTFNGSDCFCLLKTAQELEVWLAGIGLSKFLHAFKKEEFDMSSISEISENVLQQLGLPVGSRLAFLKAQREYLEAQSQKDPHKGEHPHLFIGLTSE